MDGFRDLFDGTTLSGWHAVPRLPPAPYPGADEPSTVSERYRSAHENPARWYVSEGAIVGEQAPNGGGFGGYLVTDEVFGDFELLIEARPDWPADTGIMVRSTGLGSQGFQILLDHRKSGGIGGFYGNGTGGFHALSYNVDVRHGPDGQPEALIEEDASRILWGTDWPHPNITRDMPNDGELVNLFAKICPDPAAQRRILVDNPTRMYWS